jgi:hypothetical protein
MAAKLEFITPSPVFQQHFNRLRLFLCAGGGNRQAIILQRKAVGYQALGGELAGAELIEDPLESVLADSGMHPLMCAYMQW